MRTGKRGTTRVTGSEVRAAGGPEAFAKKLAEAEAAKAPKPAAKKASSK